MRIDKKLRIFKCDHCGKESKPLITDNSTEYNPSSDIPEQIKGWIIGINIFDVDAFNYSRSYKDYCCRTCLKRAIDRYYK